MNRGRVENEAEDAGLDEDEAWALVRRTLPGDPAAAAGERSESGAETLEVDEDGGWTFSGVVSPGARRVLDIFLPLQRRECWVVGQMGQSLDGRIATESGHSHYVTGTEDIRRLHRLRALADAVVVGAGTVASDDPRLTVREVDGDDPVRIVLDPRGRLASDRRLFRDDPSRTRVVRFAGAGQGSAPEGVDVLELPAVAGQIGPRPLVDALASLGLRRVLVEGGGLTVSGFLEAGVLDRLHLTVAPLLLGSGRPSVVLPPVQTLHEALRPPCRTFELGSDVLFELDLAGWGFPGPGR